MSNALAVATDPKEAALLKAVGLDRVPPEQRELALAIADRYGLDLMLKHIVLIQGRPYITRDGLLHVAHRSGVFDGIEVTDPELRDTHWHARATVYRTDMSRGFTYSGRYPAKGGGNAAFAPEMATKVAEVMALRRAFDVSAPVMEERWDIEDVAAPAPRPVASIADKAAEARARIEARTTAAGTMPAPAEEPGHVATGGTTEAVHAPDPVRTTTVASGAPDEASSAGAGAEGEAATSAPSSPPEPAQCGSPSPYDDGGSCDRPPGHAERLYCTDGRATWPRPKDWK